MVSSGNGSLFVLLRTMVSEFKYTYSVYEFNGSGWNNLALPISDASSFRLEYDRSEGVLYLPVNSGEKNWLVWSSKSRMWSVDDSRRGMFTLAQSASGAQALVGQDLFAYKAKSVDGVNSEVSMSLIGTANGRAVVGFVDTNNDVQVASYTSGEADWVAAEVVHPGTVSSATLSYRVDTNVTALGMIDGSTLVYRTATEPLTPGSWSQPVTLVADIGTGRALCSAENGVKGSDARLFWSRGAAPEVEVVSLGLKDQADGLKGQGGPVDPTPTPVENTINYTGRKRLARPDLSSSSARSATAVTTITARIRPLYATRSLLQEALNLMTAKLGKRRSSRIQDIVGQCSYTLTRTSSSKVVYSRDFKLSAKSQPKLVSKTLPRGRYVGSYTCSLRHAVWDITVTGVSSATSAISR
jgi:hypothetical protein